MSTVTLEIQNEKDLLLVLQLAERLGLKLIKKEVSKQNDLELAKHVAIIQKGIEMPKNKIQSMLTSIEADRNDRQLPMR